MLSEEQKKKIRDAALGEAITAKISIHDQIAALRKQITALAESEGVPLVSDLECLEKTVAEAKRL